MSASRARWPLLRAWRLHEARLLAGHDEEGSEEAEAGALLETEGAAEIHEIANVANAWMEANRKR